MCNSHHFPDFKIYSYYTIISATQLYMELGMKETAEFMMRLAPEAQVKSWEIQMVKYTLQDFRFPLL